VDRLGIEFTDLEDGEETEPVDAAGPADEDPSELEESLVEEPGNVGADFDADVEAEVAELLGETEPAPDATGDDRSGGDAAPPR
jgi:hypothetical protein